MLNGFASQLRAAMIPANGPELSGPRALRATMSAAGATPTLVPATVEATCVPCPCWSTAESARL